MITEEAYAIGIEDAKANKPKREMKDNVTQGQFELYCWYLFGYSDQQQKKAQMLAKYPHDTNIQ